MAKKPNEVKIKQPSNATLQIQAPGEVKITSPVNILTDPIPVKITRATGSRSNSASSDTQTNTGSSWDTDQEGILLDECEAQSRIEISNETSHFLKQYLTQIYSQVQNTLLNIDIIKETVEWQIRNYISEAMTIKLSLITSEEIILFTTDEVKVRSRRIADDLIKENQAMRDLCPLEHHEQEIRIPEQHYSAMTQLLKKLQKLCKQDKNDNAILDDLGYTIEREIDSEENVMAFLDPELKPKLPQLPPYSADALVDNFVDEDVDIVIYQCKFCLERGHKSEGHWESNCRFYKQEKLMRKQQQQWQQNFPQPAHPHMMPHPNEHQQYPYHAAANPQAPFMPVIYPFYPPMQGWQYPASPFMFPPAYPQPQQNNRRNRKRNRRKEKSHLRNSSNRCVSCNFEAPRHELRCKNRPDVSGSNERNLVYS